ncbi:MAG: hypothetical protein HY553_21470 [Elusimicrobia bacterium]|nr:hypothetical protein [Elusimicrobiota bacterium]
MLAAALLILSAPAHAAGLSAAWREGAARIASLEAARAARAPGRAPTAEERAALEEWFPALARPGDWRVTAETDPAYNCFAWAVGVTDRRLHADGDYLEQFDEFFLAYGLAPLGPGESLELAEVAAYAIGGVITHAARRASGGLWESKIGIEWPSPRILHRLDELEGDNYGRIARFYRRVH